MKIIVLKNLGFDYGDGWIFHKLNIEIDEGDFVAVIGANGAGKSTLLKMLAHLVEPAEGSIEYYGTDIRNFRQWNLVGYVPQNPGRAVQGFPISVREVVESGLLVPGEMLQRISRQQQETVDRVLGFFNLTDLGYKSMADLSGGQQQRVFLARAMVKNPRILLLDEPSTAMDSVTKENFYRYLQQINTQKGVTIVMVSHDLDLAAGAAKSALCLDHGVCFWGEVKAALTHRHHHHGVMF